MQGASFPYSAFDFIQKLNEHKPVMVTGLLLPEIMPIKNWAAYSAASAGNLKDPSIAANTKIFEEKSKAAKMAHRLHRGTTALDLPQVIEETKFADLLVASDAVFFTEGNETSAEMLQQAMHRVHCPVVVVPENSQYPEQLMLAYDGSPSAMFAIKQFAYLLPEMCRLPTIIVYENDFSDLQIPDREYAAEWLNEYFPNNSFVSLDYDASVFFRSKAALKPTLVVAGSFGRSGLSQWLQPSFSSELFAQHGLLLFTAHNG